MNRFLSLFKVNFKIIHWIIIILLGIGGVLLGSFITQWEDEGYFSSWRQLPTPANTNDFSLVGATWGGIFVRTEDDIFWLCNEGEPQCVQSEFNSSRRRIISKDCDFNEPAFSPFVKPPQNIEVCLQEFVLATDTYTDTIAIINSENELWYWTNFYDSFLVEFARRIAIFFIAVMFCGAGTFFLWISLLIQKWFFSTKKMVILDTIPSNK